MARAISSLPVPVSPEIRTVDSVGATFATCASTRTSRSDRSLRAMPDSRFGLSLRPACGLRCRSPSHTSERYVPVRHAGACSGQETNDTDSLSGVSKVLADTRLRVHALYVACDTL